MARKAGPIIARGQSKYLDEAGDGGTIASSKQALSPSGIERKVVHHRAWSRPWIHGGEVPCQGRPGNRKLP